MPLPRSQSYRYGGNGRASIASHGESWESELDDTTESESDDSYDSESDSTEEELTVVSHRHTHTQRHSSQPCQPRETHFRNNANSNGSGIYASQLLNASGPASDSRRNAVDLGVHVLRSLFCPPEVQPTHRSGRHATSRSGGQSTSRGAPRDPGRGEREAALRKVGAHVDVMGVTQDYRFDRNISTRPCDLSPRVLENLKWVAFNFKRELPGYRITKIEFIINDRLYERFRKTRDDLRRLGKSAKEMLLYHGTHADNVRRFKGRWG